MSRCNPTILVHTKTHAQRIFFEIILNQTKIRLYLSFSNLFGTKFTSVWFQISRKKVNTIWFRFDLIRFQKYFSACSLWLEKKNLHRVCFATLYRFLINPYSPIIPKKNQRISNAYTYKNKIQKTLMLWNKCKTKFKIYKQQEKCRQIFYILFLLKII